MAPDIDSANLPKYIQISALAWLQSEPGGSDPLAQPQTGRASVRPVVEPSKLLALHEPLRREGVRLLAGETRTPWANRKVRG